MAHQVDVEVQRKVMSVCLLSDLAQQYAPVFFCKFCDFRSNESKHIDQFFALSVRERMFYQKIGEKQYFVLTYNLILGSFIFNISHIFYIFL